MNGQVIREGRGRVRRGGGRKGGGGRRTDGQRERGRLFVGEGGER